MKVINTNQSVTIPEDVDASVKSRVVTVKGPRGTLIKSFKHLAVDISMPDKKTVRVEKWFGKKKELAAVRTVCSHISNLCKGVTQVRQVPKSFKTRFNSSDLVIFKRFSMKWALKANLVIRQKIIRENATIFYSNNFHEKNDNFQFFMK